MATATEWTAPTPIHELRSTFGLSREQMGRLLEVSARTIERWEASGKMPTRPSMRRRLTQLQEIAELAQMVLTPEGVVLFMQRSAPAFGGCTALQLIEDGEGERVVGALAGLYEGVPS
jgi:transcriptional regulator with XRE-family HTH domain